MKDARAPRTIASQYMQSALPLHLQEVCSILANGLIRLQIKRADIGVVSSDIGDISLHYRSEQSGHAKPNPRSLA